MKLPEVGTVESPFGSWRILTSLKNNGRLKNYIVPSNNPRSIDNQTPFSALRQSEKYGIFEGVYVPKDLRRNKLGDLLQELSFRVTEALGMKMEQTTRIYKPGIVVLLEKYGFLPDDETRKFIYLGEERDVGGISIPVIYRTPGKHRDIKQCDPIGRPYFIIGESNNLNGSGGNVISLGTKFILVDDNLCAQRRDKINTKLKFSKIKIT